jgi:2-keto-4-pentenoate hydratase/2-oxohepta-3-ene-1,7-dioic acid hydratase in catechol pathway
MSDAADTVWRIGSAGDVAQPETILEIAGDLYALDALDAALPAGSRDVLSILTGWDEWEPALDRAALAPDRALALVPEEVEWLPPVIFPRKLVCVGANYRDHLEEMDNAELRHRSPYAFIKPASTGLLGSGRELELPASATWIDWEAEFGVVIGRRMRHVTGEAVLDGVAGYTMINDVSNRDLIDDWQPVIGMDWITHKGYDGFAPAGPLITPAKFVGDPQALSIELTIDGVVKQSSNTSKMTFGVQQILEHLNSIMTLEPGDMISTGSPAGVGYGRTPRERLEPGNEVVIAIERLGRPLVTRVVAPAGAARA